MICTKGVFYSIEDTTFRFIDIHSHILPEIDDGARDFEESLLILNEMKNAGGKGIVLTPHLTTDGNETKILDKIAHQFNVLNRLVLEMGIDMDLYLGAELMLHPDLPQKIKGDKRLTLNGKGKYVLIEMPPFEIPMYASTVFFDLLAHGVTPVWAHPERCYEVMDDCKVAYRYRDNGVLLQINAGSLLGMYGKKVRHTAATLLKNGMGDIVASDVHRVNDVKTLLPEGFSHLVKMVGNAKAVDMVLSAPAKVIHGF